MFDRERWTGPLLPFLRYCWGCPENLDFRDTSTEVVLNDAFRALKILKARGNEGLSRVGIGNSGGEPERSRIAFYNACRILKARGETRQLLELITAEVPEAESLLN